ncbi:hypothetical protein N0V94_004002 [Neodidymelliopsis sp. IMI 364377]|nr:hypothetical protein N0V94_004002 [Neodidymelliopsis sp. IMI 364377]
MSQFGDTPDSLFEDGQDLPLLANNHLFNDGPDMFGDELMKQLHEPMNSGDTMPPGNSDDSLDFLFEDIGNVKNFDMGSGAAALPPSNEPAPPPMAQHHGEVGLGQAQHKSPPVPTVDPSAIFNQVPQVQYPSASTAQSQPTFNIPATQHQMAPASAPQAQPAPMFANEPPANLNNSMAQFQMPQDPMFQAPMVDYSSMNVRSLNQILQQSADAGHQPQWPMQADQQAQVFQPQPQPPQMNPVQMQQYLQAVQNFQFAQQQLTQMSQLPQSMPQNVQPSLDFQPSSGFQQDQHSQHNVGAQVNNYQQPDFQQRQHTQHNAGAHVYNYQQPQHSEPNFQQGQSFQPAAAASASQFVQPGIQNPPRASVAPTPVATAAPYSVPTPDPLAAQRANAIAAQRSNARPGQTANTQPAPQSLLNYQAQAAHNPASVQPAPAQVQSQNQTAQVAPNPTNRLQFTSFRAAKAAMKTRNVPNDWRAPTPDATIPTTNLQRQHWVSELLQAFESTEKPKDNKSGFSFVKRWAALGYYQPAEMEKVCWLMLDLAERLHARGPSVMNIYDQDALKKLKSSRNLTFEQRVRAICDMLRLSKFLCDNLMKGEGIEMLVGAPKQKMSGAITMSVQNRRRQGWLEAGRTKNPIAAEQQQEEEVDIATESPQRQQKQKSNPPTSSAQNPPARASADSPVLISDDLDSDSYPDFDSDLPRGPASSSSIDVSDTESSPPTTNKRKRHMAIKRPRAADNDSASEASDESSESFESEAEVSPDSDSDSDSDSESESDSPPPAKRTKRSANTTRKTRGRKESGRLQRDGKGKFVRRG